MLSLYIHIPFCVRKCHYCGFYSTVYDAGAADRFVLAFQQETAGYRDELRDCEFETVYVGGGTPTALSPRQVDAILAVIRDNFRLVPAREFTVEANPNSLSEGHLTVLQKQGVNRLSLGIQSFSESILKFLGRQHTGREAADAFRLARAWGFKNIGIDLIFGIPGQSMDQWRDTVNRAIELEPEHISAYGLSLDEGSGFMIRATLGLFRLPADEWVAAQYEWAQNRLTEAGFDQDEISNFSRPGFACRHNGNYWARGEYLGLGPGASSFIAGRRYKNDPDALAYAEHLLQGGRRAPIEEEETPDPEQAADESVMLALRTSRGLDLAAFAGQYGTERLRKLQAKARPLKLAGLLSEIDGCLSMPPKQFLIANEVFSRLCL